MQCFSDFPVNQQKEIKKEICTMLSKGKGYKKIKRALANQEIKISLSTLSYWCNNQTKRLRKNSFNNEPSKELAYVIGVMFGDGCATCDKKNYDYSLKLGTIDKEFGEKFCKCISQILNHKEIYPLHKCKSIYMTNIRSKELYTFIKAIKMDFEKAKPIIEEFPTEFIQGLADSEGGPLINATKKFTISIGIANSTNLNLLNYCKELLWQMFQIETKIYKTKKIGMKDSIINERILTRTKNLYLLETTRFNSTLNYYKNIGFSINRKQEKLKNAIKIMQNKTKELKSTIWKTIYYKEGHYWKNY